MRLLQLLLKIKLRILSADQVTVNMSRCLGRSPVSTDAHTTAQGSRGAEPWLGRVGAGVSWGLLTTRAAPPARTLLAHVAGSRQGSLGKRVVKTLAALHWASETLQLRVCWLSNIKGTGWSPIDVQLERAINIPNNISRAKKDPTS